MLFLSKSLHCWQPCVALLFLLAPAGAGAQTDHNNLDENLPLRVEDAYTTGYLNRELQFVSRYERQGNGKDRFLLSPQFEYGFARNWQLSLSAPFLLGNGGRTGSGDIQARFLYNFNTESLSEPAFAIGFGANAPSGEHSRGIDTELKFIVTKTLGKSFLRQRLHLNGTWLHNDARRSGEPSDAYTAMLGYDRPVGPDTVFVADFVNERDLYDGRTSNTFAIGFRRQLTPLAVLSFGVGAGIGRQSPTARVTLGLQHSF